MLARNVYLPLVPWVAVRLTVAIVLVAVTVTMASLAKTPQYEGSAMILIGQERDSQRRTLEVQVHKLQEMTKTMAEAAQSRLVAEAAIEHLGLATTPEAFLERLDAEPVDNTQFMQLSYTDSDPRRAQLVVNTVGEIFSKEVSKVSQGSNAITATLWDRAAVPKEPVSPNPLRNGLLVLVVGLMLLMGVALLAPNGAPLGVGGSIRRMTKSVGRTASEARGAAPTAAPDTDAAKEEELLEALGRRGRLTVAGAALETSLTVKEAKRLLSALAAKGHLKVWTEHGRLLYSLWERDDPP